MGAAGEIDKSSHSESIPKRLYANAGRGQKPTWLILDNLGVCTRWGNYLQPWSTKPVISSMGRFIAIANNGLWVKKIDFSFILKIIRILSKDKYIW